MKRSAAVLTALLALALPVQASAAATNYRGKTKQGLKASARVVDGRLKLLKINWKVPCEHGRWTDRTYWEDRPEGPIEHDGSKFTDGGKERVKFDDGSVDYNLKLAGDFTNERIKGKMTAKLKLYDRSGELIDSCRGTIFFTLPRA
jgi:hypothetical protein